MSDKNKSEKYGNEILKKAELPVLQQMASDLSNRNPALLKWSQNEEDKELIRHNVTSMKIYHEAQEEVLRTHCEAMVQEQELALRAKHDRGALALRKYIEEQLDDIVQDFLVEQQRRYDQFLERMSDQLDKPKKLLHPSVQPFQGGKTEGLIMAYIQISEKALQRVVGQMEAVLRNS